MFYLGGIYWQHCRPGSRELECLSNRPFCDYPTIFYVCHPNNHRLPDQFYLHFVLQLSGHSVSFFPFHLPPCAFLKRTHHHLQQGLNGPITSLDSEYNARGRQKHRKADPSKITAKIKYLGRVGRKTKLM